MKCPFTSKCHTALARELDEARAAHQDTIREAGETISALKSENSILRFKSTLTEEPIAQLNWRARRERSKYQTSSHKRAENPCAKCDEIQLMNTSRGQIAAMCSKWNIRVNKSHGTCPSHSAYSASLRETKTAVRVA